MDKLNEHESVIPVVAFSYPPQRGFIIENERLVRKHPEHALTRSQDLEKIYHDAGQFYFVKTDALVNEKTVWCKRAAPLILSELEVQDLDTLTDWQLAEMKYQLLKKV